MVFNYQFTNRAANDLDEIFHYIAIELNNLSAASSFMTKLEKLIGEITTFPKCGALLKNVLVPVNDIRKLPITNYMLYYRFDESDECIVILRIIYGRCDPQQTFKNII